VDKYCPTCFNKFPNHLSVCPEDETPLVSFANRDLTGEVLDKRYEVIRLVGKGGMGVVYEARQKMINRTVALKVLRREVVQDETSVKRFLNEGTAIASLKNNHTVTLYDFGVTQDGLLYYTMELLEGEPLSSIIKREGPLDHRRAVDLILQSCESFEEAHDKGILHRDIKPDNLFVLDERGRDFVKVLDFGIAKLMGENALDTITQTGMICGTPRYLSPEQVTGEKAGPESDLYSLGVVLYEMLTGAPPFSAETPMKVMLMHLQDAPRLVTHAVPGLQIPVQLELFIQRALQKDRQQRFSSVREFVKTLETALASHDAAPAVVDAAHLDVEVDGVTLVAREAGGSTVVREDPEDPPTPTAVESVTGTTPPPESAANRAPAPTADITAESAPPAGTAEAARPGFGPLVPLLGGAVVLLAAAVILLVWRPWVEPVSVNSLESTSDRAPGAPDRTDEAGAGKDRGSKAARERTVARPGSPGDAEEPAAEKVEVPTADVVEAWREPPGRTVLPEDVRDLSVETAPADSTLKPDAEASETARGEVETAPTTVPAVEGGAKAEKKKSGGKKKKVGKKHKKPRRQTSSGKGGGASGDKKAGAEFGGFERLPVKKDGEKKGDEKKDVDSKGFNLERLPEK